MSERSVVPIINSSSLLGKSNFRVTKKQVLFATLILFLGLIGAGGFWFTSRYKFSNQMPIKLTELSNAEYPENPAALSKNFQRYSNRKLTIIKKDDTRFDFVLEPTNQKTAKIVIKNVELNLFVPKVPAWTKKDPGLEVIALTDREWNRQQVSFPANSANIEITGGDGFEKQNIVEIALANNCLNAGYWEVLLFTKESNNKSLYYQSWFTFPMGHYKNVFEKNNNISYWKHWWRLEHWQDPSGTVVNMPMGIGVPPFYQSYEELQKNHPDQSPYFSVLLDSNNKWIDHHRLAIDGPVMHLDQDNPNLLHLYLLSYERNTLVTHLLINLE
ncbi:hypothetical protein CEN39_05200 [Fischerella thermalis CCMEE 5201]|nr:hypothetical protein CEN39_05200 [Fischerella thermalis CCMEE 5201]